MAYYIASVSWGKDSLAMLLRLIAENRPLDEVVFFDTGMEFQAIYSTRDAVLPLLKEKGIGYTEIRPAQPFLYTMLHKPVRGRERTGYGWCGGRCRWGTTEKLKLLDRYACHKEATVYIGIAADEPQRLHRLEEYKVAPLVTLWGMNEAECLQYCYAQGYQWLEDGGNGLIQLYDVLDRVSCWCCCNKNLKELKNIYRLLPDYWQKLKYLQFCQERPMKGFYKGQPRGVMELEERFEAEITEEAKQMKDMHSRSKVEIIAEIKRIEAAIKTSRSKTLCNDYRKYLGKLNAELRRRV